MNNALTATNRAANIIAGRLEGELASLYEQIDEIESLAQVEPMSDQDRSLLRRIKQKVKALDPTCPDVLKPS